MLSSKGQPETHGNGAGLLRRIEALDEEMNVLSNTGSSRWMVPYADFVTVLLGLFMVLFALNPAGSTLEEIPEATTRLAQVPVTEQIEPGIEPLQEATQPEEIIHMLALINEGSEILTSEQEALLESLKENLTVYENNEGLVLSLKDSILFAPGNARLETGAEATLDHLVEALLQTDHPVRVEGHTDNTPIETAQYPSNWELSTARATAIVRYLADRHGIPPERLSAVGYGEFHPVAENSSIEGKQKNRRVDIVILSRPDLPQNAIESPREISVN